MGRKSLSGGVYPSGRARIQVTFQYVGVRYSPTLLRTSPEANLRRAREQLACIKACITTGTFSFAEEFPDFVHMDRVPRAGSPRICNQVFDYFLANCAARGHSPRYGGGHTDMLPAHVGWHLATYAWDTSFP